MAQMTPEQLIEKIMASEFFANTERLRQLLQFFFQNRHRLLSAKDVEIEHFGRPEYTQRHNPKLAISTIDEMKERLEKYIAQAPNNERVRCDMRNAKEAKGYQLRFRRLDADALKLFWESHLGGKPIQVFCDPLLFFYSHAEGSMLRFLNVNVIDPNRIQAREELDRLHLDPKRQIDLVPGHFYVNAGAIMAAEYVRKYFWEKEKAFVPLRLIKENLRKEILSSSSIVIGNVRTNSAMRQILSTPKGLAYQIHHDHFSWVTIEQPNSREIASLKECGLRLDDAGNGIVETPGNGMLATLSDQMTLGIVSRFPNPNGSGVITFISSYAILNVAQMALALTNEDQLQEVFSKMGWRLNKEVPDTFEMIFRVNLAPGNCDDEASEAKLLCWRPLVNAASA